MLAVEELRDKAGVERVIVEATGVAQPSELLETLADSSMPGGLRDRTAGDRGRCREVLEVLTMLGDFYLDQIESADIVIANKIDLGSPSN